MTYGTMNFSALSLLFLATSISGFYRDRPSEQGAKTMEQRMRPLQARDGDEFCKLQNLQYVINYGWKRFPMSEWPFEHAGAQFIPDMFAPQPDPQAPVQGNEDQEKPQSATLTCLDIRIRPKTKQPPKARELERNPELSMAYMSRDELREYDGVQMYCLEGMTMSIAAESPHFYNWIPSQARAEIHMSRIPKSLLKKTALLEGEYIHPTKVRCLGTPTPASLAALFHTLDLQGLRDRKTGYGRGRKRVDYTANMPRIEPAVAAEPERTLHISAGESKCLDLESALRRVVENIESKRTHVLEISAWHEEAPAQTNTRRVRPRIDPDADTEGLEVEESLQQLQEDDSSADPRMMRLVQLGMKPQEHPVIFTPIQEPLTQNPGHRAVNAPYIDFFSRDRESRGSTHTSLKDTWERFYDVATLQAAQLNMDSTYTACASAPINTDLMLTFNSFSDRRE